MAWNATTTSRVSPDFSEVWIVSGTMDLVVDDDHGRFTARPGKSTYAYDFQHAGCSPTTHQEGTLETSVQSAPDDGVAQALISGPVGQELEMSVFFDDAWMVSCAGGSTLESVLPEAFPGCSGVAGSMTATLDALGTYVIVCDIDLDFGVGSGVTGHAEGSLSPGPGPTSGP